MLTPVEIRHFHLFAGLGGGARGFNRSEARVGQLQARFRCIGGNVSPTGGRSPTRDAFDRLSQPLNLTACHFDLLHAPLPLRLTLNRDDAIDGNYRATRIKEQPKFSIAAEVTERPFLKRFRQPNDVSANCRNVHTFDSFEGDVLRGDASVASMPIRCSLRKVLQQSGPHSNSISDLLLSIVAYSLDLPIRSIDRRHHRSAAKYRLRPCSDGRPIRQHGNA